MQVSQGRRYARHHHPMWWFLPVEVDSPKKITWDLRDDWLSVLVHFVKNRRMDLSPYQPLRGGESSLVVFFSGRLTSGFRSLMEE